MASAKTKAPSAKALIVACLMVALVMVLPIATILALAFGGNFDDLAHLVETILPRAVRQTVILLVSVAFLTSVTGVATAWLTVMCDFPFRRVLSVALILPLAIPTYLAAYAFGEFFDYTGPLQSTLRAIFGFTTARDYWFPDIHSMPGAVFVLSAVLYPYLYLTCRSVFLMQGRSAADVARTLGANPLRVLLKIQIPMARPAIIVGIALVLMETLNDIGAVQFLGVQTLTASIYDTWLNRGSLHGAAQMACLLLTLVVALTLLERHGRRRQRFSAQKTTGAVHDSSRLTLKGLSGLSATALCMLPVLCGFAIPALVICNFASRRLNQFLEPRLIGALGNSLFLALCTALITVILAFLLSYARRTSRSATVKTAASLATFGYGVPGTVLAIGVLFPLAAFDNAFDGWMRLHMGFSTGLLLTGSGFAIIYACSVRFLTLCEGTIDAGFQKLSHNLDTAARTLGRTRWQTFREILLPMMRPATLTAALLVFIDTMKELSATMLLRPFNFNTLATLVYEDASRARIEDSAVPALIIILVGLIPVILVSRSLEPTGFKFVSSRLRWSRWRRDDGQQLPQ
ncbi:MAG: hypothetical protein RIR97_1622 [Pseudomonadota bacterium]